MKKEGKEGRPLHGAQVSHSFHTDYNVSLYHNEDARKVEKVRVTSPVRILDSQLEWHLFQVPKPKLEELASASSSLQYNPDASSQRESWRKKWLTETGGKISSHPLESDQEMEMIRRRVRSLIQIIPINFLVLLYEIKYRTNQMRFERQNILDKMETEKYSNRKQSKRKRNRLGKIWEKFVLRPWSLFGFDSPTSASVLHYGSCFHIGIMTMPVLVQDCYEMREMHDVFGERTKVSSRSLGVIGMTLVFFGCIIGIIGHYLRKRKLILMYILIFFAGMGLYLTQNVYERHFAEGDGLGPYLMGQVNDYKKLREKANTKFLQAAQLKFRCCGHKGAKDYASPSTELVKLPQTCCATSARTSSAKCEYTVGQAKPYYLHFKGCTSPVKQYLNNLFSSKILVFPFMIFGTVITILTLINLYTHRNLQYADPPKSKQELESCITFKPHIGQLLLQAIQEATTIPLTNVQEVSETIVFPSENLSGTIDNVRKRLGDCENISEFIPVMLQICNEFETSSISVGSSEPEVIARAILGIRPKRFASNALVGDNFEMLLQRAPTEQYIWEELLKKDLKIRIDMQKQETHKASKYHLKKKEKKYFEKNEHMNYPLPRPLSGLLLTIWKRINDTDRFVRHDKYYIRAGDKELDPLDPEYLQSDRIIELMTPVGGASFFVKFWAKLCPPLMEAEEAEYLFLEKGLYGASVNALTNIIAETQAIIRDVRKKTKFRKVGFSKAPIIFSDSSVPKTPSSLIHFTSDDIDMDKVNDVIKKLCELEVIREERLNNYIQEQEINDTNRKNLNTK